MPEQATHVHVPIERQRNDIPTVPILLGSVASASFVGMRWYLA